MKANLEHQSVLGQNIESLISSINLIKVLLKTFSLLLILAYSSIKQKILFCVLFKDKLDSLEPQSVLGQNFESLISGVGIIKVRVKTCTLLLIIDYLILKQKNLCYVLF